MELKINLLAHVSHHRNAHRHASLAFAVLLFGCFGAGCVQAAPIAIDADAGNSDAAVEAGDPWTLADCESSALTVNHAGAACVGDFVCYGSCPCGGETIRCVGGVIETEGSCIACADGGSQDAGSADVPTSTCATEIGALASTLDISGGGCTITLRMDYQTRELLGYQSTCGGYMQLGDVAARSEAMTKTGFGMGAQLSAVNSRSVLYYTAPGDFGGVGVLREDTGLAVFGGGIVWDGRGEITYPSEWRPATELGADCPALGVIPALGWDLRSGEPLDASDVEAAMAVVRQTAAPAAMGEGGYVFDAAVMLYPRTVGAFDPASAEWVVLLNGGWLE